MKRMILLFIIFCFTVFNLAAHPHITINAYNHYYFDDDGLMGFYIQWIFDPLFSSQIISDCDTNLDNSFSEEEKTYVENYYFSNLTNYQYFINLMLNNENEILSEPINFDASINKEDEVVIFSFYFPFRWEFENSGTKISIEYADPTNYTAFLCAQQNISNKGGTSSLENSEIDRLGAISFTFFKK